MVTKNTNITKTSSNTYRYVESQIMNGVRTTTVDMTFQATPTQSRTAARESPIVEAIRRAFPEIRSPSVALKKVEK